MLTDVNLWPLISVAIIVAGLVLRFNPVKVVIVTAIGTALAAGFPIDKVLATIGTGFMKTRNLPLIILLPLAVIGLLERHGLRQHAQNCISSIQFATAGRLLHRLPRRAPAHRGRRADQPGRPSADGASAAGAHGRRRNPVALWRAVHQGA